MVFSHPVIFYISLALLPLLAAFGVFALWRRQRDLRAFGERPLVDKLLAHLSPARQRIALAAFLGGVWLLALAWAGPQFGSRMVEVRRYGVDVLVALDVSRSMLAEDIKPSRLQRAQQELSALIDRLTGDRVGVIAFAGNAEVACPLTSDFDAVKMFLSYLSPTSVTLPGTSLGEAIRLALATFPQDSKGFRTLILLTDGEDHHSATEEAAAAAKAAGVHILCIGFGTPGGEPIPVRDSGGHITGYMQDASGRSVVSRLDAALLQKIAQATDGAYWPATTGSLEADRLAELIGQMQKRELTAGQYGTFEDRFQFALLPAVLLLLFALWLPRRAGVWWLCLVLGLAWAAPARAGVGADVSAGNQAYEKKNYPEALQKYQDAQIKRPDSPLVAYDLGNAFYKNQNYGEAGQAYREAAQARSPRIRSRSWYNLGNDFFQLQKYAEAAQAYRQALRLAPRDPDALNNLALALRFLKSPPPQPTKQPTPSDKNKQAGGQNQRQDQKDSGPKNGQEGQAQNGKPQGPDDRGERQAGQGAGRGEAGSERGQARAPRPGEMSKEEAEQLLQAVREAEQDLQKQRLSGINDRGQGRVKTQEDW